MPDNLVALEKILKEKMGTNKVLDYSLDSLDDVEMLLARQLDHYDIEWFSLDKLIEVISTYMGEIAKKKLNGRWALCTDEADYDFGYPMITDLDGLPKKFGWSPIQDVFNYRNCRKKGLLKQATQSILNLFS